MIDLARIIAKDPTREETMFGHLVEAWECEHYKAGEKHYADKSQHVIWFTSRVLERFPDCRFIGIQRSSPLAFVSSAIVHAGIPHTMYEWKRFPVPNRYFGIISEEQFRRDPMEIKLLRMWMAHKYKMFQLKERLREKFHLVIYEDLIKHFAWEIDNLCTFLDLDEFNIEEYPTKESLNKWKNHLTQEQIKLITDNLYSDKVNNEMKNLVEEFWE